MSLEDDIARVAAMRGRSTTNYRQTAPDNSPESVLRRVGYGRINACFYMHGDPKFDLKIFDALPMASRLFLREAPINISAIHYSELLEESGSQGTAIELLARAIPAHCMDAVRHRYGLNHPQAGGFS